MKVIENIEKFKLDLHNIVLVWTSSIDYEMDRFILLESFLGCDYVVVYGSHCSCYDFDDCQWGATGYSTKELIDLAKGWITKGFEDEKIFAKMILKYLREDK